jgi:hypothetical protein
MLKMHLDPHCTHILVMSVAVTSLLRDKLTPFEQVCFSLHFYSFNRFFLLINFVSLYLFSIHMYLILFHL